MLKKVQAAIYQRQEKQASNFFQAKKISFQKETGQERQKVQVLVGFKQGNFVAPGIYNTFPPCKQMWNLNLL